MSGNGFCSVCSFPLTAGFRRGVEATRWDGGEAGEAEQRGGWLAGKGEEERKGVYAGVPVVFSFPFFFFFVLFMYYSPPTSGLEQGLEATG